jgi:hypothetical protein
MGRVPAAFCGRGGGWDWVFEVGCGVFPSRGQGHRGWGNPSICQENPLTAWGASRSHSLHSNQFSLWDSKAIKFKSAVGAPHITTAKRPRPRWPPSRSRSRKRSPLRKRKRRPRLRPARRRVPPEGGGKEAGWPRRAQKSERLCASHPKLVRDAVLASYLLGSR